MHIRELKLNNHRNQILQRIYNKHGDVFKFEIIETCEKEKLIEREQHWINILKPQYNLLPAAGNNLGYKYSEESKAKMSAAQKGKIVSQETREKQRQAKLGRKQSEECRRKISEAMKGRMITQEAIAKQKATIARKKEALVMGSL